VFFIAARVLPPLREHLDHAVHTHPVRQVIETFESAGHLRSFALTVTVMLGSFSVIPFISMYLVENVGVSQADLTWVFVTGGTLTLVGAPLIGRVADRLGKLRVFRTVALVAVVLIVIVTNLPRVPLPVAAGVVGAFMLSNAGRMTAALAMITGSVERRRRGGFMSANSAVQHLSSGLGAVIAGWILPDTSDGRIHNFYQVGLFAVAATLLSLWVAGRVRSAVEPLPLAEAATTMVGTTENSHTEPSIPASSD
jgi:DHA1 family inner membrane transport protein